MGQLRVRRKRDYVKIKMEDKCDVCRSPLKLGVGVVRCEKCGSTYQAMRDGRVRVHPACEALFRRRYTSIAGETPEESVEAVEEAKRGDLVSLLKTALAEEARGKKPQEARIPQASAVGVSTSGGELHVAVGC
jgi:ribosomal protein L37AE/L43A